MVDSDMDQYLPRVLFIGAGSQGHAYAGPITRKKFGRVVAIAEPLSFKRKEFGEKYIWGKGGSAKPHQEFEGYEQFIEYEKSRRERIRVGEVSEGDAEFIGIDAVFICVLDELHLPVCNALAPLGLHIMCEKPLATRLDDCTAILQTLKKEWQLAGRKTIFGIGHVLRYSPQNVMLRKLVREEKVIGDIVSLEHTEPIGWWHMTHSFVRGNWKREDMTAPSLLTKSCHDMDFVMWLLSSPSHTSSTTPAHLPAYISSMGHLTQFRRARKPLAAGKATNCLSCPIEDKCLYSAKKIYVDMHLNDEGVEWPLKTVVPEIEELYANGTGREAAKSRLLEVLAEDYPPDAPVAEIKKRPWFGRCVWECDNDVCDDQVVTITWDDDPLPDTTASSSSQSAIDQGVGVITNEAIAEAKIMTEAGGLNDRGAKTAVFHMISPTESVCERRGKIYGTLGELTYQFDGAVSVYTFSTGETKTYEPSEERGGGHGGGDDWLAENFCRAVRAVKSGEMTVEKSQKGWLGCDVDEIVRSHVAVFAAERARTQRTVVDFKEFWSQEVKKEL